MNTLKEILEDTSYLDALDVPDIADFKDADELREYVQERIYEYEIIYYHNAMKYLSENDSSLMESFELAKDSGLEIGNLNSETLATIHIQNAMSEELGSLDFSELFEE